MSEQQFVGGRPPYERNQKDAGRVEAWIVAGYKQDEIAERLDISVNTLKKYYPRELRFARMDVFSGAVNNLVRMCLGAPAQYDDKGNVTRAEVLPDKAAIFFYAKTQHKDKGWSERHEVTGKDGAPLNPLTLDPAKLKGLSDEQLAILATVLPALFGGDGGDQSGTASSADEGEYAATIAPDEGAVAT